MSIKIKCVFVAGTFALINPNTDLYTPLMYAATGMAVALWFSIMLLPLVQVCIMCEGEAGCTNLCCIAVPNWYTTAFHKN